MNRHPADLVSLTFGVLFVAAGLIVFSGGIDALALEWVGPLAVIGIGAVLIMAARPRRASSDELTSGD